MLCVNCNTRKILIRKASLCAACYQKTRRELRKPKKDIFFSLVESDIAVKKVENRREMDFIKNYFTHNNWIFEPCAFKLPDYTLYKPDFYDGERNVFIEVAGTRQAYHANKHKYDLFVNTYPMILFEIRVSDGSLLGDIPDGDMMWESQYLTTNLKEAA